MDYESEQTEELEVLESIYPDAEDLEILDRQYPNVRFVINTELEPQVDDFLLTKRLRIFMEFVLPEKYPEEPPIMKFHIAEELLQEEESEDEDEEQEYDEHGNKIDRKLKDFAGSIKFDTYIPELQTKIDEQIEEEMLLGTQMCFALISSIKELSEEWYTEKINQQKRNHEKELQNREKEEQKKFRGTKVTKESFLEWRLNFRKELSLDEKEEQRRLMAHHGRMTGKQIFQNGLAGELDEEDEELSSTTEKLSKSVI